VDSDSGSDTDTDTDADSDIDGDTDLHECDGTGDCYGQCWDCALESAECSPLYKACVANQACADLDACQWPGCEEADDWEACFAECVDQFPDGEADLLALWNCIYCEVCAQDCGYDYECGGDTDTDFDAGSDDAGSDSGTD
jgi:hypothetical protein